MNILEYYRKIKGLTQEEFAKQIGISRSFYALIENKARKPHPETAIAIEKATGGEIKKEWLLFPDDYQEEIRAYIEGKQLGSKMSPLLHRHCLAGNSSRTSISGAEPSLPRSFGKFSLFLSSLNISIKQKLIDIYLKTVKYLHL